MAAGHSFSRNAILRRPDIFCGVEHLFRRSDAGAGANTGNWWQGKHVLISSHAVKEIFWVDRQMGLDASREQVKASPSRPPLGTSIKTMKMIFTIIMTGPAIADSDDRLQCMPPTSQITTSTTRSVPRTPPSPALP
jgi:hypothetical protein